MNSQKTTWSICSALLVLLGAGCGVVHPKPVSNPNAAGLPEPVSYYGNTQLFAENKDKLRIKVNTNFSNSDIRLAESAVAMLQDVDYSTVGKSDPFDIQISVKSSFKQITPPPQCRVRHMLEINIASVDGIQLFAPWTRSTESNVVRPTYAEAQSAIMPAVKRHLATCIRNAVISDGRALIDVSVLRFKTTRKFIEFDPYLFETDLRVLLNELRKIDGVLAVRMIEADKEQRIASFRVVFRKDMIPGGLTSIINK